MTGSSNRRLGQELAPVLDPMQPGERAAFLAHAEARAKAEGNFQMLRALKEYRDLREERASSPTTSSPTSMPEPPAD